MATGVQTREWTGPSRRRVPRFTVQAPLDVTVQRSGLSDTLPGRSLNVGERGLAAVLAGELIPGESVGIELRLPRIADALRTRATVRFQGKLQCGMEFVGLSAEQRAAIREWAKTAKAESDTAPPLPAMEKKSLDAAHAPKPRSTVAVSKTKPKKKFPGAGLTLFLLIAAIAVAVFWWRWNRGWEELESGVKATDTASAEKPQAQVAPEVMAKLITHRVEPTYPAEARAEKLEGTIAIDIVVGRDGSVVSMHALNGPDVLARSAMNALRWWKFEPYRINGEPAIVETTVAVEFKR
ncbi:MAG TPA: TonB family protein [Candidatus Solibacter sp.]|nr:TonB family protein [Candidatus Solibacter sp.]